MIAMSARQARSSQLVNCVPHAYGTISAQPIDAGSPYDDETSAATRLYLSDGPVVFKSSLRRLNGERL
jgi:hypothetical protein